MYIQIYRCAHTDFRPVSPKQTHLYRSEMAHETLGQARE